MTRARFFLLTGGETVGRLLDRAAAHGKPGRAVAHGNFPPGPSVHGAIELHAPTMCGGKHSWVARPRAVVCSVCDETMVGTGPTVRTKAQNAKENAR